MWIHVDAYVGIEIILLGHLLGLGAVLESDSKQTEAVNDLAWLSFLFPGILFSTLIYTHTFFLSIHLSILALVYISPSTTAMLYIKTV